MSIKHSIWTCAR